MPSSLVNPRYTKTVGMPRDANFQAQAMRLLNWYQASEEILTPGACRDRSLAVSLIAAAIRAAFFSFPAPCPRAPSVNSRTYAFASTSTSAVRLP